MSIPTIKPSRARFEAMAARFADLPEISTGLPDMEIPGFQRSFKLVLGSEQPKEQGQHAPSGSVARPAITEASAPCNIGIVKASAGNGVMMHNHNTNETFVVLEGRWRVQIQGEQGDESLELGQHDAISIPPHVQRAFDCLDNAPGKDHGLLLAIVGNATEQAVPAAVEFAPEALAQIAAYHAQSSTA